MSSAEFLLQEETERTEDGDWNLVGLDATISAVEPCLPKERLLDAAA